MKRTLWSLLVGAAAVLPTLSGVRETFAAPVPASASRSLPDLRQTRRAEIKAEPSRDLRLFRNLPGPAELVDRVVPVVPAPFARLLPERGRRLFALRPALRLPPVRAPSALG